MLQYQGQFFLCPPLLVWQEPGSDVAGKKQ